MGVVPVIGPVRTIIVDLVAALGPKGHKPDINNREQVVIITNFPLVDMNDATGQCELSLLLENFRIIEAFLAGNKAAIGLIVVSWPHGCFKLPGKYFKAGMTIFGAGIEYHTGPADLSVKMLLSDVLGPQQRVLTLELLGNNRAR